MARRSHAEPIYKAANLFHNRCVEQNGSFLWPDRTVWTIENLDRLWKAFVGNPDTGRRSFYEKWQDQLTDEPEDVHRIAADLMAFYYLHPNNVGEKTKLADVKKVLAWKLEEDAPELDLLQRAYAAKLGNAGMHYLIKRPWQINFLLDFFRELKARPITEKEPEAYQELADEIAGRVTQCYAARHITLHLLFPDQFERIASQGHKQKIVDTFRDRAGGAADLDEALASIRKALVAEYGREDLDFYDADIHPRWNPAEPVVDVPRVESQGQRTSSTAPGPLNLILYGPPGTGKTYSVQNRALSLIESSLTGLSSEKLGERYRHHVAEGRVEFVTFHPSYSYEEFVEGYRYNEQSGVPTLHKGVFRRLAERAVATHQPAVQTDSPRIWKVSLGGGEAPDIFDRSIENNEIAIGWLEDKNLTGMTREDLSKLFVEEYGVGASNSPRSVDYFINWMEDGDYVAVLKNQREIRAVGVVNGTYHYKGEDYENYYPHTRPVEWINHECHDIYDLNGSKYLTLATVYPLDRIPLQDFVDLLPERERSEEPHVLVIDEINRGNLSRIFGELITLLEEDKRRGAENELSVRLPYSGLSFTVPKNLHVIGTMNSADRSIALLDVALRRRFEFEEMMPDSNVIKGMLEEQVSEDNPELDAELIELVCGVFEILNKRLTVLLDRDHRIGHSYFLSATSSAELHRILYKQVFPLLQEYFYDDSERLTRLLGRYNPAAKIGFVAPQYEYRNAFDEELSDDELPWEFHVYPPQELKAVLRDTFLG